MLCEKPSYFHGRLHVAAVDQLDGHGGLGDQFLRLSHGHGRRSSIDVTDDVRVGAEDLLQPYRAASRDGGSAGVHHHDHAVFLCPLDQGSGIFRCLDRTETDLPDDAHAFLGTLLEVFFREPLFQDQGSAEDFHAPGPECGKGFGGEYGKDFGSHGVLGPARKVDFSCGDRRGYSAVEFAVQKIELLLPGCEVSQDRMHVGINETGRHGCPGTVDNHLCGLLVHVFE